MRIAIASDHAGFPLKEEALAFECADAYLKANFIGSEPRFIRRLNKVKAIEKQYMPSVAGTTLGS